MATAAGAAVILYIVLIRRLSASKGDEEIRDGEHSRSKRRVPRRPAQAPATWLEAMTTVSDTLRFTYSETLGKWPIGDLAFGIKYLMRRQVYIMLVVHLLFSFLFWGYTSLAIVLFVSKFG